MSKPVKRTDPAQELRQWAELIASAPTATPVGIGAILGVDPTGAQRLGSQLILTPPVGTTRLELVLNRDDESQVRFVEATYAPPIPLEDLTARFGPGQAVQASPHDVTPTVIFDDVWPDGAARGCTLMARLDPSPVRVAATIVLYVQTIRLT